MRTPRANVSATNQTAPKNDLPGTNISMYGIATNQAAQELESIGGPAELSPESFCVRLDRARYTYSGLSTDGRTDAAVRASLLLEKGAEVLEKDNLSASLFFEAALLQPFGFVAFGCLINS